MIASSKIRAARRVLARRLGRRVDQDCIVVLDRLKITASDVPIRDLERIPGFYRSRENVLRQYDPKKFVAYQRVVCFVNPTTGCEVCVRSEPRHGWLAPFSIMIRGGDEGVKADDVLAILELISEPHLVMAEIAWDFSPWTEVTRGFVRRHGLFGKATAKSIDEHPGWDAWGRRRSAIFIRSYRRRNGDHRVELQLNARWLRRHQIEDIFQLHRLVDLLPGHHIRFVKIDFSRLITHLRNGGRSAANAVHIGRVVAAFERKLWIALGYLRRTRGLTNVHRLLVPVDADRLIRPAIAAWAAGWPREPRPLPRPTPLPSTKVKHATTT